MLLPLILSSPISKTGAVSGKLMWKFSDSRDYKVHKAYEVLLEDANQAAPATIRPQKRRGISTPSLCPFCDTEDESFSHLFLHCHFVRACSYGSQLAIHTSTLSSTTVQQWLTNTIIRHKWMDKDSMKFIQL